MYRRYTILWIALLALLGGIERVSADARSIYEEAQRRFDSGTYELSIERFRVLRREYPNSEYVLQSTLRIGQSLFYLGEYHAAYEEFARLRVRAQRGGELQQEAVFWSGLTDFQLANYPEAIQAFSVYLENGGPQRSRAFLYRGVAYIEEGSDSEGRADLTEARNDLDGAERGYAVAKLLAALDRLGDDEEIIAIFREETEERSISEAYRESVFRLAADALFRQGKTEESRQVYRDLARFSTESAQWAYQRLYQIAENLGDREEMDRVFRRAEERLASEPERLRAFWLALGSDAIRSERYELAELYLSRLWQLRETEVVPGMAALLLATSLERQGRVSEGIDVLEESLSEDMQSDETEYDRSVLLARLLFQEERFDESVRAISQIEGFENRAPSLYLWSIASFRLERYSEVIRRLETPQGQTVSREIPSIVHIYARSLLEDGRPRDAVGAYRLYLAERPSDVNVRVELIRGLVLSKEFSAALQEIDRIDRADLDTRRENEIEYLTGLSRFHRQEYPGAIESFSRVEDLRYEPLLSYHLAWSLYRTGAVTEASRTIATVLDALPPSLAIDGSYLYGWTLYAQDRAGRAVDVLLPLIGSGPSASQMVEIRRLLAASYLDLGEDDDAIAQYQAILSESDAASRGEHWNRYAAVLAAVGRDEAAVAEYDEIADRYESTEIGAEALLEAGQILATIGRYADGRERFRRYRNRYPDGPSLDRALYWGGQASLELNEAERALLWWEPLVQEYPRSSYTPRALYESAVIHAQANRRREALELFDRYVAAYPEGGDRAEAERRRQELRLQQSGLSSLEAGLWAELEPANGDPPPVGSDRWFELVLQLGQIAIREQITLSFERGRIVPKLLEATEFEGDASAEAGILLAEYYQRRGETRRAIERYVAAASTDGASDELRAQSLFRLAELADAEGDSQTASHAASELIERYPETIWADQARRLIGDDR